MGQIYSQEVLGGAPYMGCGDGCAPQASRIIAQLEEICARVGAFIDSPEADQFDRLAPEIFAFQFEHNPAYRAYCKSLGKTPPRVAATGEIPALVTSAFKDFDLTVLPEECRTAVFHSSGTTEQRPSRHFHAPATLQLYERSVLASFASHLLPGLSSAAFLILTPPRAAAPRSSLVHMFETVSARFGEGVRFAGAASADGSWNVDFEAVLSSASELARANLPVILCGTAFSFVHLCDFLEASGRKLEWPAGSRVMETGGYKGRSREVTKPQLHGLIHKHCGIPLHNIVSEYGMSELSSQGYDRVAGAADAGGARRFRFPPWARAEVISPETGRAAAEGETGLVRIVDLANVGSVMSIQTEDLAIRRGDGLELIGRATQAEARGCSLMQIAG